MTLVALGSAALRRSPDALAATLVGVVRAGLRHRGDRRADGDRAGSRRRDLEPTCSPAPRTRSGTPSRTAWGTNGFGGFGSSALAALIALVEVFGALFVWLELIVRNAVIYIAVLFFPVALAASIWPALGGWTGRLGRLLLLFVILKPVTLIVLSLAGNAAAAGLSFSGGRRRVGRDDPRRGRDLRARRVRAVGADVPALRRRRERLRRRRCARRRGRRRGGSGAASLRSGGGLRSGGSGGCAGRRLHRVAAAALRSAVAAPAAGGGRPAVARPAVAAGARRRQWRALAAVASTSPAHRSSPPSGSAAPAPPVAGGSAGGVARGGAGARPLVDRAARRERDAMPMLSAGSRTRPATRRLLARAPAGAQRATRRGVRLRRRS